MITFDSKIKILPNTFKFDWSQEEIKNEPMLFNCSLNAAYELGGPITKNFLENLPKNKAWRGQESDWLHNNPVIDSRVHMLMPGWYSCIPGWHHDDVPRSTHTGQPNYTNPEYHSEHLMGLVNAEICPTKFKLGQIKVPDPDIDKTIYEIWSNHIDESYSELPEYLVKSGEMVEFNCNSFHEGTKAVAGGWRWFIRLSHNTDRQKTMTNELRKQVQVYLEYPKAGW